MSKKDQYIKILSGNFAQGETVGTSIGQLRLLASLGGNWYGTNKGDKYIADEIEFINNVLLTEFSEFLQTESGEFLGIEVV